MDTPKNSTLKKIHLSTLSTRDETSKVNLKKKTRYGKSSVLFENRGPVISDSTGTFSRDVNEREGWHYLNTSLGNKFNLYYFDGTQETIKLGEIKSVWSRLTIDNFQLQASNIPHFVIYTKPTGVGDAGAFYHSRICYEYNNDEHIGIGEECVFYGLQEPEESMDNRKVRLNLKQVLGDGESSEEVLFITLQSNSGATGGQVQCLISDLGFQAEKNGVKIHRSLKLIGYKTDHVFHDKVMNNELVLAGATYTSEKVFLNTLSGLIGWQIQGTGTVSPNQWTVNIGISMDDSLYEFVPLNSQFIEKYDGTQSIIGNIKDIKPIYVKIRIENGGASSEQFSAWVSH